MKIAGIIPARYASTRFPGKPLAMINGTSMIERVYRQAQAASKLSDVVVATDNVNILDHVTGFGGKAIMTATNHPSGTDRCAEVLEHLGHEWDAVINIQGDEPYIQPEQINQVAARLHFTECQIATLIKPILSHDEYLNVNIPKTVIDNNGRALYFSRRSIPFIAENKIEESLASGSVFRHIGIYGYRAQALREIALLPPSPLEQLESLEQLRWLYHGYAIHTDVTHQENHAVDVPEDVLRLERLFKQ